MVRAVFRHFLSVPIVTKPTIGMKKPRIGALPTSEKTHNPSSEKMRIGFRSTSGVVLVCLLIVARSGTAQSPAEFASDPLATTAPGQGALVSQASRVSRAAPADVKPAETKPAAPPSFWSKVPPVRIFPPTGNFQVLPTGPGYYSLLGVATGTYRQAPPKYAYPRFGLMLNSFFDADFRYLESSDVVSFDPLDRLHRVHLGDNWLFNTGGTYWSRWEIETNSRLSGKNNSYDLIRSRVYGDLWFRDRFRIYSEFIYADSLYQDLPPLIIDVDRGDLLNMFVDGKLFSLNDKPAYLRVGRQEMLLGSQRLISPLEWANTRRTFQGARAFRQGEKFDLDVFWMQPVIPNATQFNWVDNNQSFAGAWATYRSRPGRFFDLYYLYLRNKNSTNKLGLTTAPYGVSTFGTRYAGNRDQALLWDVELMMQLGAQGKQNIAAGAATTGIGYHFANAAWSPVLWMYYDYASGDHNPGFGSYNTFNQLFPFGHFYLGWIDLVGRQNIRDINTHLFLYPTKWLTLWFQYHHFNLASSRDALYNAAGVPIRRDATGASGTDVGNEFDFILNCHLSKHSDFLMGTSTLFQGTFLRNTGFGPSPNTCFFQYSYRW